ncbi:MAG: hypothetical protein V5A38_13695 [Halolamina sp.]
MFTPRRLVLPTVLVVLVVLVVPAVALPPPEPVCTACAPAYEGVAADTGIDIGIAESAAVVRVHENGSATWTVGLVLAGPDADRLSHNGSLHERIARETTGERFAGTGPWRSSAVADISELAEEGENAVYYRYRHEEFASQSVGGTLVTTHFREDLSVANYDSLGVDRLTVAAPGMEITHAPPSADVISGLSGSAFTLTSVDQAIVTVYPAQATTPIELLWISLVGRLSIAQVLLPVVRFNVSTLLLPAFAVHAVTVGAVLAFLARVELPDAGASERRAVAGLLAIAAVGLAGQPLYADAVGLPILGDGPNPVLLGPALGLAVIASGVAYPTVIERSLLGERSPDSLGRGSSLAVKGGLVAAVAGVGIGGVLPTETAWDALGLTLLLVGPTFALLPAGYCTVEGRARSGFAVAAVGYIVGGFASPALYTQPQGVIFSGLLFAPFITGAVLAVGWPLLLAGWILAGTAHYEPMADAD